MELEEVKQPDMGDPARIESDVEAQASQESARQPKDLIITLRQSKEDWEKQDELRQASPQSDRQSRFASDRDDYAAAMQKLQKKKRSLEVDWLVLSEAKMDHTQNSPTPGTPDRGTDQDDVAGFVASQDENNRAKQLLWITATKLEMSGMNPPRVPSPEDIKKLEDAAENLNDEEKAIKRQRVELVGSLEAPEQPPAQGAAKKQADPPRSYRCVALLAAIMFTMAVGIGLAAGCMVPAVKTWDREDIAGHPVFVVPIYTLLVIPIGLYLTHDVIDKRWRIVRGPITSLHGWARVYCFLRFVGLALLTSYAYVQFNAGANNEGMAAAVSCSVAIYGGYLYMRQRAVLRFFSATLQEATARIRVLGVQREWNSDLSRVQLEGIVDHLTPKDLEELFPGGPCYAKLSSALLDDNYPGDGPRVTWLSWKPDVVDKLELVARVGLWILLAAKPPMYSFAKTLRPHLGINALDIPADPSSTNAVWTIDLARFLFSSLPRTRSSNGGAKREDRKYFLSEFRALVRRTMMDGWTGVTAWVEPLSRIPTSEWAQALAEHSSREVVDLHERTVAWEILLCLCSPQMKIEIDQKETLIERLERVIQQFGVLGACDVTGLSEVNKLELLELEVRAKKWSLLICQCFKAYRPECASTLQLEFQVARAKDLDMLIAATLMLGIVRARELELDCKFYLSANKSTLLLHEREKHVVGVLWDIARENGRPVGDAIKVQQ